jgi:hypothetical protein
MKARKGVTKMKFILKLIFAPVIFLLWVFSGLCNLCVRLSAAVLIWIALLFAVVGIVTIVSGSLLKGLIGLLIAFLLCPYGLPMLATLVVARLIGFRLWIKERIYG